MSNDFDKLIENRNQKSYIAEYSAPKIILPELEKCENNRQVSLAHKIKTRIEELSKEYKELIELYEWNKFVEGFEIRIETVVGQIYYLYERDNGSRFLSLISPDNFFVKYKFHGSTTINSEGYFVKSVE
jgi:hypothetical protein